MDSKKNILLISPFFYPEPISTGKFNADFVVALKENGHNVKVLCFHPFYPNWKIKITKDQIEGVKIIRGGRFLRFFKTTILRRLLLELSFTIFILRKSRSLFRDIDIITPVFPPSLAFYSLLFLIPSRVKKVGMIHDLQEIYSNNKKGFINKIVSFFIHKIEKRCLNSCDKLIFLSNEMKEEAIKLYHLNNELVVQYPFYKLAENITNDLDGIIDDNKVNIVYSGALGEKQNPQELYDFFNFASKKLVGVNFLFFSQGDIYERLKHKNKNPLIKFFNLVPKENLEELYCKSDIQIIPQLSNTSKGSLPSKLPNLLAFGCKVLVITDKNSEIDLLFKKYNLEKVVTTWDFDTILSGIKSLIENKSNTKKQIKVAKELFTIESMVNEVLS